MTLQSFDAATLEEHGELAEKMIRKLRSGMMPPAGARRPEPAVLNGLLQTFESRMDKHAALNPNPGLAAVSAPESRRVFGGGARPAELSTSMCWALLAARHDQPRFR